MPGEIIDLICSRISREACDLAGRTDWIDRGDKLLLSDIDLLRAEHSLTDALSHVRLALDQRPLARKTQSESDAMLDRLASAARQVA